MPEDPIIGLYIKVPRSLRDRIQRAVPLGVRSSTLCTLIDQFVSLCEADESDAFVSAYIAKAVRLEREGFKVTSRDKGD